MTDRRSQFNIIAQLLVGILLAAICGLLAWKFYPQQRLPQGWQLIAPPDDVMALLETEAGILAGGKDGLALIERASGKFQSWAQAEADIRFVTSLATDGKRIWVTHENGLSESSGGEWHSVEIPGLPPGVLFLVVYHSPKSGLWVGTSAGLAHNPGDGWRLITQADGLNSTSISVILEDSLGRLWVGDGYTQNGGLNLFSDGHWTTFTTANALAHNMVNALLETTGGAIWVGTGFSSRGGASHFDGQQWSTLTKADGLAGERVRSLYIDRGGRMLFGSEVDGLAIYDGENFTLLTPADGLAGWEIKTMLQDSTGDFWIGTERGLNCIRAEAWMAIGPGD